MNTKLKDGKVQLGELTGEDEVTLLFCYFHVTVYVTPCAWCHCWQARDGKLQLGDG
jgi:hypothetical protein